MHSAGEEPAKGFSPLGGRDFICALFYALFYLALCRFRAGVAVVYGRFIDNDPWFRVTG